MGHALTKKFSQDFFESPTVERFLELQRDAIESDGYDFTASKLLMLETKLNSASPSNLMEELEELPAILEICPRFHYVEARIRESLGEVDQMQESISRLRSCLTAIVETGEGTKDSPFNIAFVSDQDDIARSFGERIRCTSLVHGNEHSYEVVTAHSGIEFWFDVTQIVAQRHKSHQGELAASNHESKFGQVAT